MRHHDLGTVEGPLRPPGSASAEKPEIVFAFGNQFVALDVIVEDRRVGPEDLGTIAVLGMEVVGKRQELPARPDEPAGDVEDAFPIGGPMPVSTTSAASAPRMMAVLGTSQVAQDPDPLGDLLRMGRVYGRRA